MPLHFLFMLAVKAVHTLLILTLVSNFFLSFFLFLFPLAIDGGILGCGILAS
jgi:hypothetical protein